MNYLWIIAIVLLFFGVGYIARRNEERLWNNGKCECGGLWKNFDTDSQGGRGYNCSNEECDNSIWISYKVDKTKRV